MGFVKLGVFFGLVVVAFAASFSACLTDPRDVSAMNSLCLSLNFPPLRGWQPIGGDPCGEEWEGVSCVFSNITAINLNDKDLVGTLTNDLGLFPSIIEIDLSKNHIGGAVPSNLPLTIRSLSLAGNEFNGSIPDTLSSFTQLLQLSLNNNKLSGEIPDAFLQMTLLTNLDLSDNDLSGPLPPSMGNLLSLNLLYLQNNKLVGILDVLENLPLRHLNIENNLFSGPIPAQLLNIPDFRKDGNPFNTSILSPPPSPPPRPPPLVAFPPFVAIPPSSDEPGKSAHGPAPLETTNSVKNAKPKEFFATTKVFLIAASLVVLIIVLGLCLCMSTCCKRRRWEGCTESQNLGASVGHTEKPASNSFVRRNNQKEKVLEESTVKFPDHVVQDNRRTRSKPNGQEDINLKRMASHASHKPDHEIDTMGISVNFSPSQAPKPRRQSLPIYNVFENPTVPAEVYSQSLHSQHSLRVFTIAALQQCTNSFSEGNLLGEGMLGNVYRAELPDGKVLAVKKLISTASRQHTNEEFLQLVSDISKIRHDNIVNLVGYCNEHGQRLLVYEYCANGTLHDALHVDDGMHKNFSWNERIRLALGAARALLHLHEVCEPPIEHQNFRSVNILLDEKFAARVSDCGLAPLKSSVLGNQLMERGYSAPEFELGIYTCKSDIYSFGVVMLELLTGRKVFDSSRSRWEQSLVRWAVPQLHDIDALSRMVDPTLNGAYTAKSLSRFADIIFKCVQWEPEFRPPISEVVQDLLHMI